MPMTLREARDLRGLTQEQLADRAGVDQATISNLENGRVQFPSWDTVARVCGVLKVKPQDIFPLDTAKEAS